MNEQEILFQKFKAGDQVALRKIYDTYGGSVFAIIIQEVIEIIESVDMTAAVFIQLWDNREQFKTMDNIRAFLYFEAHRLCDKFKIPAL